MAHTIDFTVTGQEKIHCAACEQRIGNALKRLEGVEHVVASAETQHVQVTINPAKVQEGQVQARLEQLGYEMQPGGGRT